MKHLSVFLFLVLTISFNSYACKKENKAALSKMLELTGDHFYNNKEFVCGNLKNHSKSLYNKLNTEEVLAIYAYTTNGYYKQINKALRSSKKTDDKKWAGLIQPMINGLKKLPKYVGSAVRFESKKSVSSWTNGKIKKFKAFTSSSKDPDFHWSGNVKFLIKAKSCGRYIAFISDYPHEEEVLFLPGTRFEVGSKKEVANKTHINLKEVSKCD